MKRIICRNYSARVDRDLTVIGKSYAGLFVQKSRCFVKNPAMNTSSSGKNFRDLKNVFNFIELIAVLSDVFLIFYRLSEKSGIASSHAAFAAPRVRRLRAKNNQ